MLICKLDFIYDQYIERILAYCKTTTLTRRKAKLILELLQEGRTINEIASENNIHSNILSKWKRDAESCLYRFIG